MRFFKYTIVMTPEKMGKEVYYNVQVPALPEIATFGDSKEEARFMVQDALELSILSRLEDGEDVPADVKTKKAAKNALIEEIVVSVAYDINATPASYVKTALFQST